MAKKKKLTATKFKEILANDPHHNTTYLIERGDWEAMLVFLINSIDARYKEAKANGYLATAGSLNETWHYLVEELEPYESKPDEDFIATLTTEEKES